MNKRTEAKFRKLVEKLIADMEAVDCPMYEFIEALNEAAGELRARADMSRHEAEGKEA